jgi:hypothetical protein
LSSEGVLPRLKTSLRDLYPFTSIVSVNPSRFHRVGLQSKQPTVVTV